MKKNDLFLILVCAVITSCKKTPIQESSRTAALHVITASADLARLPLLDTHWKLLGFVDARRGIITFPDSDWDGAYTVLLQEDGGIDGRTAINYAKGSYRLVGPEPGRIVVTGFGPITYAAELGDGPRFVEAMNAAFRFAINSRGLQLHYDKDGYLLFQPKRPQDD